MYERYNYYYYNYRAGAELQSFCTITPSCDRAFLLICVDQFSVEVSQTPSLSTPFPAVNGLAIVTGWDGKIGCLFLEMTMNLHLVLLSCR